MWDTIIKIAEFVANNWEIMLGGILAMITAAMGIAMAVPGDQPDKFLQAILDFLMKFSRKKDQ
jgi:hypothetical protein